jgi:hypothetical protein
MDTHDLEDLETAVADLESDLETAFDDAERARLGADLADARARLAAARAAAPAPSFGEVLAAAFSDKKFTRQARRGLDDFCYAIGDGTPVCLRDWVTVPEAVGGLRAGQSGLVVMLDAEGLGLRFKEAVGGIRNEFFDWDELRGALVSGIDRKGKRKFVTPPKGDSP